MAKNRKNLVFFAMALALILIAFYFPWLTNQQYFYTGDIGLFFEPLCTYIGKSLAHGHLPLWNPFAYCGMPQIAIPSPGLFYPPNWLFALLPFNQSLAILLMTNQLVCGLGFYLLVTSLGWGTLPAVCAGLIAALNGYMFSLEGNYTLAASAAWFPICLWSLVEIKSLKTPLPVCLTSLAIYLLITAGRPEIVMPAILIFLSCIAYSAVFPQSNQSSSGETTQDIQQRTRRQIYQRSLLQLSAITIGILASMPEILPAAEWLLHSRRSQGLAGSEVFMHSANWYDMLSMMLAMPLGDLQLRWAQFLPLVETRPALTPYLSSSFVGPVALTLSIWGAMDKSWTLRKILLAGLLLALIIVLGEYTPIMPFLSHICPAITVIRYPVKFLIFIVFGVALLAARGLHKCLEPGGLPGLKESTILWILCLTFAGIILSVEAVQETSVRVAAVLLLAKSLIAAASMGLACCTVTFLFKRGTAKLSLFACVISGLMLQSLIFCAWGHTCHGTGKEFYTSPSYIAEQIKDLNVAATPVVNTGPSADNLNSSSAALPPRVGGLSLELFACPPELGGFDREKGTVAWYQYWRQMLRPNTNMDYQIPSMFGYESAMTGDFYSLFLSAYMRSSQRPELDQVQAETVGNVAHSAYDDLPLARFFQLNDAPWAVSQKWRYHKFGAPPQKITLLDPQLFELAEEDEHYDARIYKVIAALPWAYISHAWSLAPSHKDAVEQVGNPATSGFNPRLQTILEASGTNLKAPALPCGVNLTKNAADDVLVQQDLPEHIVLSTNSRLDGILVLADQYYPGWQATIDSQPTPILCANAIQRAVAVPHGKHQVEFDYRPQSLFWGLVLMGISFFLLIVVMLLCRLNNPENA